MCFEDVFSRLLKAGFAVSLVLSALKLLNVIEWGWHWVLLPWYLPVLLLALLFLLSLSGVAFRGGSGIEKDKDE